MKIVLAANLFFACFLIHAQVTDTSIATPVVVNPYLFYPYSYGQPYVIGTKVTWTAAASSDQDSIPLHLLQRSVVPIFDYGTPPPWLPWYPYPIIDWHFDNYTISWVLPECGDTYHQNGKLASSIECVDSVFHGKAFFWDETGHKTDEQTFFEGHLIKSKNYDSRGRMVSLHHYNYSGQYDGVQIAYDYDNATKIIEHYRHGVIHGIKEEYHNGMLMSSEKYTDGVLTESRLFFSEGGIYQKLTYYNQMLIETRVYHSSGQLAKLDKWDSLGRDNTVQCWNERGVLISESQLIAGKPVGIWLDSYNDQTGYKVLTEYKNGLILKNEQWYGDFLAQEIFYENGNHVHTVNWFENGDTAFYLHIEPNDVVHEKKWMQSGNLEFDYRYNAKLHFVGKGFYHNKDTLVVFEASENPSDSIPLTRWIISSGDTVRMDYCMNSHAYRFSNQDVLASNHYVQNHLKNEWVKHGVWKIYSGNNLFSVITYDRGIKQGRAVYYASEGDSVFVSALGSYHGGLKAGEWTTYTDTAIYVTNYLDNRRSGKHLVCDSTGYPLVVSHYQNDTLHGVYEERFAHDKYRTKIQGSYKNGLKHGEWIYFDNNFEIIMRGTYKNGIPVGKWFEHRYNKRGKMKAHRIARPPAEMVAPPIIEQQNVPA